MDNMDIVNYTSGVGIPLGAVLAIVISFNRNHSLLWAIVHGLFGWLYVLYYALILNR